MIGQSRTDDFAPTGSAERQLQGRFDRLAAAGGEQDAVQIAGGEFRQFLGKGDPTGGHETETAQIGFFRLFGEVFGKLRVTARDVETSGRGKAVDQPTTRAGVLEMNAFALGLEQNRDDRPSDNGPDHG